MDFRLSPEAESWFSNLKSQVPFKTKFDMYYFCLMIGMAAGRKSEPTGAEFVDHFIDDYRPSQKLICGLLTAIELRLHGIDIGDRAEVRRIIAELFDPSAPTGLSEEGMRNLNRYAAGGFALLAEARAKPHHADEFVADYLMLLKEVAEEKGFWAGPEAVMQSA